MRLRFSSLGFILLMLGVLLIYVRIPFLDVVGVVLFFAGLLMPVLEKPTAIDVGQSKGVGQESSRSPSQMKVDAVAKAGNSVTPHQEDTTIQDAGMSRAIARSFLAGHLLGGYLKRIHQDDPFGMAGLIELSKHPDRRIRRMSCRRGFFRLEKYDEEVIARLREMEEGDPEPAVREEARKARLRLERIRGEASRRQTGIN